MVSKKSLRKIFNRFADKTAMQGVGYIKSAKLWYSRALWVFLLLVAIGWMVFHLFYLISHFLELPIQTKISLGFNNLPFPAVTICNMNAVKWSRLTDTPLDLQEIVAKTDPDQFNPGAAVPGKVIVVLTLVKNSKTYCRVCKPYLEVSLKLYWNLAYYGDLKIHFWNAIVPIESLKNVIEV